MRFTGLVIAPFFNAVLPKPAPKCDDYDFVVLTNDSNSVTGNVTFTQYDFYSPTEVYAKTKGLVPDIKHGFHVHETGDLAGGCDTLGLISISLIKLMVVYLVKYAMFLTLVTLNKSMTTITWLFSS